MWLSASLRCTDNAWPDSWWFYLKCVKWNKWDSTFKASISHIITCRSEYYCEWLRDILWVLLKCVTALETPQWVITVLHGSDLTDKWNREAHLEQHRRIKRIVAVQSTKTSESFHNRRRFLLQHYGSDFITLHIHIFTLEIDPYGFSRPILIPIVNSQEGW